MMETNEKTMNIVEPKRVENVLSAGKKERATVFGKWMWVYFWVTIASIPAGIAAGLELAGGSGTIIGTVIIWALSAVLAYALFQTGTQQRRLRVCAWLTLVELAADVVLILSGNEMLSELWDIPDAIIGLIASYQFMKGCAESLLGVDNELSGKWERLWKWRIRLIVAMLIGAPVLLLVGLGFENALVVILMVLALLALVLIAVALMILEMVYTCRTAKIFRGIAENL